MPILSVGKARRTLFGPLGCKGSTRKCNCLVRLLPLCRRTLGSERHLYAIAWPGELGTDLMAYGGINKRTPPRKSGGIQGVSTRFSLSTVCIMSRLTRNGKPEPVSRNQILGRVRGQRNIILFVQLATSRIDSFIWLNHTLLYVMMIHTYK